MIKKLKNIDFGGGIRGEDIQHNFDALDGGLKRERARTGGHGIVEGFEIDAVGGSSLRVGAGVLITKGGEELLIEEQSISVAPPESRLLDLEGDSGVIVDVQGELFLPEIPYSAKAKGIITTSYYQENYPAINDELRITVPGAPDAPIRAVRIDRDVITVDANAWRDKRLNVNYAYAQDRMDTLFISEEGELLIQEGIATTSISHVDMKKEVTYYALAIVEVRVGENVALIPHTDVREYRKIYVDKDNNLYINGKLYKESQVIHFEEPEDPYINAIWYDEESNKLMIWADEDGTLGWVSINEEKHIPVKELKMYAPEDFPEDNQTFIFDEEEINLRYIPGHHQLEIIVDNAPLMSDQFEEIVDDTSGDEVNRGIGFRLKDPLDRATYLELRVFHTVHATPLRRTFQRTATFVDQSFTYQTSANKDKAFETDAPYVIGESQLEVYINGGRAQLGVEFTEVTKSGSAATSADRGKSSHAFRITKSLPTGSLVSYKISKNIYSYDNLDGWVDEIEKKALFAIEETERLEKSIDNVSKNTQNHIESINNTIGALAKEIAKMSDFVKKTDVLELKNLPAKARQAGVNKAFSFAKEATASIELEGIKSNDLIQATRITASGEHTLMRNIDFSVQNTDSGSLMLLNASHVSNAATVYITGVALGI